MIMKTSDVKHSNFPGLTGTYFEPEIAAKAMEAGEQKGNKDFTGIQGDGSKFAARKSNNTLFLIIQK